MSILRRLSQFLMFSGSQSDLGPMSRLYFDVTATIIKFLFVKSVAFTMISLFLGYPHHGLILVLLLPVYGVAYGFLKQGKNVSAGTVLMIAEHMNVLYLYMYLGAESGVFLFCFIYVVLAFFLFRDRNTVHRWSWVGVSIFLGIVFPNLIAFSSDVLPIASHPVTQLVILCVNISLLSSILFMLQTLNYRCVYRLEVLHQEEEVQRQRTVDRLTYQHLFQNIVSGIADEIRNPLAAIYSRIELLERDSKLSSTDELIDLIEQKLQRIVRLTQSMLQYSSAPRSSEEIDLNGVIRDVMNSLSARISEQNVSAIQDIKSVPKLIGDNDKLFQVFYNIILNALESYSTKEGNELTIKTGIAEDSIFVLVTDNGAGIDRNTYNSMFLPFYSTKTNRSGLGLAIAVQNSALFGGRVSVESNPGFGTSFRVVIPIRGENIKQFTFSRL